jgi:transcriptional regulator with XRE-family HTH domain
MGTTMRNGVRAFSRTAARRARERAGLTQAELAILIGVTDGGVSAWESGTRAPTGRNLVALARVLSTPPIELLNLREDELRLADVRALYGLSGDEVASRVGIGTSTLYDVERGDRRPTGRTLDQLAKLYGLDEVTIEEAWERGREARVAAVRGSHGPTS